MAKNKKSKQKFNKEGSNNVPNDSRITVKEFKSHDNGFSMSASKYLRLLLHLLGLAHFNYSLYYWCTQVNLPTANVAEEDEHRVHWGGKLKFLTFLNAVLQAVYYIIALSNDIFGSNEVEMKKVPLLRQLRDAIFAILVVPVALSVCLPFWVIYAYDRELIFPSALDEFFPSWLNHAVHTNVLVFILLDMHTCFRRYPKRFLGVAGISFAMFSYLAWLHIARSYCGRWAYPIFDVLNLELRYLMFLSMILGGIIFYLIGELLNNFIWRPELTLLARKEKKIKGL